MADVFISYSRRDQAFVRRLHAALEEAGRESWVDWEGIPPTAKWMDEVRAAIDASDAFVFVVSPESAGSPVCRQEAEHAAAVGKRIVPIVWRETPEAQLPDAISAHNWLFLREADDFEAGVATLLAALDTDLEWVHLHTRLVTRAREWEANARERSYLLRGRDLDAAERALAGAERHNPSPTPLQTEYVFASRRQERRGQRVRTAALSGGLVAALVLAGFALLQLQEAISQRTRAEDATRQADMQRLEAERQATLARARELTAAANSQLTRDPELSILLANSAVELVRDLTTDRALREALGVSRVRSRYVGHLGEIRSLAYSGDGSRLVTTSYDGSARIWDVASQKSLQTLHLPSASPVRAAVNEDGSRIAAAMDDGSLVVWDGQGGVLATRHAHERGSALDVAISPDGSTLLSTGFDGRLLVSDMTDLHQVRAIALPVAETLSVASLPDGAAFMTGSSDFVVRMWDAGTGQRIREFIGNTNRVFDVTVSQDGLFVASGSEDGTARIWDIASGGQIQVIPHSGPVFGVAFSRDGRTLATAAADGNAYLWDVITGKQQLALAGHNGLVADVAFQPGAAIITTGGRDGTVRSWATRAPLPVVDLSGHFGPVNAGDITRDGTRIVTVGRDDAIAIVADAETGKELVTLRGHQNALVSVEFSTDGTRVLTASWDKTARVWDAATGVEISKAEHDWALDGAVFDPTGERFASFTDDGIRLFQSGGGLVWHAAADTWIRSAVFSPDGSRLFAGDTDGTVSIRNAATGESISTLAASAFPSSMDVSPDGLHLAAMGGDGVVRVWDLATQQLTLQLKAPITYGWTVRYSPDGRLLATGGGDGAAHVWDAATGERLADLKADPDVVLSATFTPSGDQLLLTTQGSGAMVVPCELCGSTDSVIQLASQRLTRDFTADERLTLLGDAPAASPALPAPTTAPPTAQATPLATPFAYEECSFFAGGCHTEAGPIRTVRFSPALGFELPSPADYYEEPALLTVMLDGDAVTFLDAQAFHGSDGRSEVAITPRASAFVAYLRSKAWMHVSADQPIEVDGHPGLLVEITSDTSQDLPIGSAVGFRFYWTRGETLRMAVVDLPQASLLVFADYASDQPLDAWRKDTDDILSSIRFR